MKTMIISNKLIKNPKTKDYRIISTVDVKDIKNDLETYYSVINCHYIDIVSRQIGKQKKRFDFIIDDEGRFNNENLPVTHLNSKKIIPVHCYDIQNIMDTMDIVGTAIICNVDDNGNETDLTDSDIRYLYDSLIQYNVGSYIVNYLPTWYEQINPELLSMFGNNIISM